MQWFKRNQKQESLVCILLFWFLIFFSFPHSFFFFLVSWICFAENIMRTWYQLLSSEIWHIKWVIVFLHSCPESLDMFKVVPRKLFLRIKCYCLFLDLIWMENPDCFATSKSSFSILSPCCLNQKSWHEISLMREEKNESMKVYCPGAFWIFSIIGFFVPD